MERRTGKSCFYTIYCIYIVGCFNTEAEECAAQHGVQNLMWLSLLRVCVGGVMFLDGQQTGPRQPQGASSVTGAQEGRAQLDVMAPSFTRQLQRFHFLRADTLASNSAHLIVSKWLV